MNIMILSDDHGVQGFEKAFLRAKRKYGSIDAIFHAGDSERENANYYESICGCPVYIVKGNCDYNRMLLENLIQIGEWKFFLTHGNRYEVNYDLQKLFGAAKEREANIVIYGHTHKPNSVVIKNKSMLILNPGSLTEPRGSKYGSFVVLVIDEKDKEKDVEKIEMDYFEVKIE